MAWIRGFLYSFLMALTFCSGTALAQAQMRVSIPSQAMSSALTEFGRQTGTEIIFEPDSVRSLRAPRVEGVMAADEALGRLLTGSGLSYRRGADGAYLVARSETQPRSSNDSPRNDMEEIVVTARRRPESLRDVPAAITALGSAELERIGAAGFEDFVRLAPGLTMVPTSTAPNFSIRGISTSTTLGTTQQAISLYVDDTPTQDPFVALSSFNLYLADIDRVEVLRGPQGTLFGSGSLSGAIRVITHKPDPSALSGYGAFGISTVNGGETGTQLEGMINVPLSDTTAIRVLAYDRRTGGYIDNVLRDETNVNGTTTTGTRIALKSQITDAFSMTGTFMHQVDNADDGSRTFYTPSQGDSDQWASQVPDRTKFKNTISNLFMGYEFDAVTLTSSTSYLERTEDTVLDASPDLAPLLGVPGSAVYSDNDNSSRNLVQELRLTSKLDGPFSYVLGAYYSSATRDTHTFIRAPLLESFIGLTSLLEADLHSEIEETALFGEAAWKLTDTFELAAGVRAFHNEVKVDVDNSGLLIGPPVQFSRVNKDDSYTPRFTATWKPSEDLTVYGQVAQGYRLGQANVTAGPPIYDSDTLWNYEIGTKGSFFDNRVQLGLALFYIDWQDLQVGLRVPDTILLYTGNAGSARSVGAEFEGSFGLTEELTFQTAMSYNDARLTESIPNLPQPSGVLGVEDGDRLPGAPLFTISNAFVYDHQLSNGWLARVRLDHQYVGKSYNTFTRSSALEIGDYHLVNLSGGLDIGAVSVDIFVRNVFDGDGVTNANFDLGLDVLRAAWRVVPRSIGLTVRKNF